MKNRTKISDYVKANRKGSREAENELTVGFSSTHKIHPSKKTYNRTQKHKNGITDTSN